MAGSDSLELTIKAIDDASKIIKQIMANTADFQKEAAKPTTVKIETSGASSAVSAIKQTLSDVSSGIGKSFEFIKSAISNTGSILTALVPAIGLVGTSFGFFKNVIVGIESPLSIFKAGVALIGVALGNIGPLVTTTINVFGGFLQVMAAMAVASNPFTAIAAGLTALSALSFSTVAAMAAMGAAFFQTLNPIEMMKKALEGTMNFIGQFINPVQMLVMALLPIPIAFKAVISVAHIMLTVFSSIVSAIWTVLNPFKLLSGAADLLGQGFNAITSIVSAGVTGAFNILSSIVGGLVSLFSSFKDSILTALQALANLKLIGEGIVGVFQAIWNVGTQVAQVFVEMGKLAVQGLQSAISTSMDFNKQMSNVASVTGATKNEFESMRQAALQVGADTSLSASQAAEALYNLGSAGFNAKDSIAALQGTAKLAEATQSDLGLASSTVAAAIKNFGLEATESTRVANVFAMGISATQLTMGSLSEGLKYAGFIGGNFKMSLEEITAALGLLVDRGIDGSMAGTALRSALTSLIKPTKDGAVVLDEMGLSAEALSPRTNSLAQILGKLEVGIGKVGTAAQQDAAYVTLFGERAGPVMQALVAQGAGALENMTQKLTGTSAAFTMAQTQLDNAAGSILQLQGSWETLAITIGDVFQPAIKTVADSLILVVNYMSDFINSTGLGAAATQMFADGATFIVQAIASMIDSFSLSSNAVDGFLSAIQGTVDIITTMVYSVGTVALSFANFANALLDSGVAQQLFNTSGNVLISIIDTIASSIASTINGFTQWISESGNANAAVVSFKAGVDLLCAGLNTLASIGGGVISSIKSIADELLKFTSIDISGALKFDFAGFAKDILDKVSAGLKELPGLIYSILSTIGPGAISVLTTISASIVGAFLGIFNAIIQALPAKITEIGNLIRTSFTTISEPITASGPGLVAAFSAVWDSLAGSIPAGMAKILGGLSTMSASISESVMTWLDGFRTGWANVQTGITGETGKLMPIITAAFALGKSTLTAVFTDLGVVLLSSFATMLGTFATSIGPETAKTFSAISTSLDSALKTGNWGQVWTGVSSLLQSGMLDMWNKLITYTTTSISTLSSTLGPIIKSGLDKAIGMALDGVWIVFVAGLKKVFEVTAMLAVVTAAFVALGLGIPGAIAAALATTAVAVTAVIYNSVIKPILNYIADVLGNGWVEVLAKAVLFFPNLIAGIIAGGAGAVADVFSFAASIISSISKGFTDLLPDCFKGIGSLLEVGLTGVFATLGVSSVLSGSIGAAMTGLGVFMTGPIGLGAVAIAVGGYALATWGPSICGALSDSLKAGYNLISEGISGISEFLTGSLTEELNKQKPVLGAAASGFVGELTGQFKNASPEIQSAVADIAKELEMLNNISFDNFTPQMATMRDNLQKELQTLRQTAKDETALLGPEMAAGATSATDQYNAAMKTGMDQIPPAVKAAMQGVAAAAKEDTGLSQAGSDSALGYIDKFVAATQGQSQRVKDAAVQVMQGFNAEQMGLLGTEGGDKLVAGVTNALVNNTSVDNAISDVMASLKPELAGQSGTDAGSALTTGMAESINAGAPAVEQAAAELATGAAAAAKTSADTASAANYAVGGKFAKDINAGLAAGLPIFKTTASEAVNALRAEWEKDSSKTWGQKMGGNILEGLKASFAKGSAAVLDNAKILGDLMVDRVSAAISGGQAKIAKATGDMSKPIKANSPPTMGPLKDIESWGTSIGNTFSDSIAAALAGGNNVLSAGLVGATPAMAGGANPAALASAPVGGGSSPVNITFGNITVANGDDEKTFTNKIISAVNTALAKKKR